MTSTNVKYTSKYIPYSLDGYDSDGRILRIFYSDNGIGVYIMRKDNPSLNIIVNYKLRKWKYI